MILAFIAFVLILWSAVCCAHGAHRVLADYASTRHVVIPSRSFLLLNVLLELPIAIIVVGLIGTVGFIFGSLDQAFLYWASGYGAIGMWVSLFLGTLLLDFVPQRWTDRFRPRRFRSNTNER